MVSECLLSRMVYPSGWIFIHPCTFQEGLLRKKREKMLMSGLRGYRMQLFSLYGYYYYKFKSRILLDGGYPPSVGSEGRKKQGRTNQGDTLIVHHACPGRSMRGFCEPSSLSSFSLFSHAFVLFSNSMCASVVTVYMNIFFPPIREGRDHRYTAHISPPHLLPPHTFW